MEIFINPVLARPSCFYNFKILVFFGKCFKAFREEWALGKIGVKITADYPMILFLGSVAVKDLYFHSRQVVGNNVAGNEYDILGEILHFLYAVCPFYLVF